MAEKLTGSLEDSRIPTIVVRGVDRSHLEIIRDKYPSYWVRWEIPEEGKALIFPPKKVTIPPKEAPPPELLEIPPYTPSPEEEKEVKKPPIPKFPWWILIGLFLLSKRRR